LAKKATISESRRISERVAIGLLNSKIEFALFIRIGSNSVAPDTRTTNLGTLIGSKTIPGVTVKVTMEAHKAKSFGYSSFVFN
jgi:hypothetical protein